MEIGANTPAVVTGGASGLGEATARALAAKGAKVAILDMNAPWTVDKASLATDAGYSIYEGHEMACQVRHALGRGRFALRDGHLQYEEFVKLWNAN